jgi:hypothetical protein
VPPAWRWTKVPSPTSLAAAPSPIWSSTPAPIPRVRWVALALALFACLPGGDAGAAVAATLAEAGEPGDSPYIRWLLFQATGDRAHLAETKRRLDASLAKVPAEHHAAMLTNLRLHREIVAAAAAAGS